MTDLVEYETHQGIATISLNRPHKLNAIVPAMVEALCGALARADAERVGVVRLAGRGRAFCAGHDLREGSTPADAIESARQVDRIQDVTRLIRRLECPVIAMVHGYALGAGCEIALGSDLVVAADDARFGFPEVGVGLGVTGGLTQLLPATIGAARAKELLFLGRHFSGSEALQWGLVNRVVHQDQLDSVGMELALTLSAQPRAALSYAKRAVDRGSNPMAEAVLEREQLLAQVALASSEAALASEAFQAKRDGRLEQPDD